ncbi:MAG: hypothetical protein WC784_01455 [Candidatus Shapirobacteria bacterium]|jgi:hypothetical protein
MLKRAFFKFLLCLVVAFSVGGFITSNSSPIFAADTNLFLQKQSAMKKGIGLEAWTNEAMGNNLMSLFNGLVGDIPESVFETGTSATSFYFPGGAIGTMNNMIAALNTPPASGIEYIAQVKDSFLGKPAYAQGTGFTGLQFLLPLWRGFRNVVYILSSIIFIVIGIMIMLRVKISPQAVVTVQSAIPKLITTLILVTFSYAIAGLVIDLCNLVEALVIAVLFSVKGVPLTETLFPGWWGGTGLPILSDIGNFFGIIVSKGYFNFTNLSNPNLHTLELLTYRASPGWFSTALLGGLLGSIILGFFAGGLGNGLIGSAGNTILDIIGRGLGGVGGGIIGAILIPLILSIIVSIWLIKLYFGLIKCYVTIIFNIIFAPLRIAMGAFPNSKIGFTSWLLDVVANMAVFPVVGIFLVILNLVIDAVAQTNVGSSSLAPTVWAPSLISVSSLFGSTGGIAPSIIAACIGFAGLALISKLPEMVPQYIFMIKPSPWGQAIGQGIEGAIKDVQKSAPYQAGETYVKGKAGHWTGKQVNRIGNMTGNADIQKFGANLQTKTTPEEIAKEAAEKIMR